MTHDNPPSGPGTPGSPGFPGSPESGGPPLIDEQIRHTQVSALIPESVGRGVFSTGAIVTQGSSEFVVDFLQTLSRPHGVAARIVMAPLVMGQWISVLRENLRKYEQRFGKLPPLPSPQHLGQPGGATSQQTPSAPREPEVLGPASGTLPEQIAGPGLSSGPSEDIEKSWITPENQAPGGSPEARRGEPGPTPEAGSSEAAEPENPPTPGASPASPQPPASAAAPTPTPPPAPAPRQRAQPPHNPQPVPVPPAEPRPSIQDVYDDLKIPEEVVSGAYANAVMVGHAVGEFYFDFITNFYPRSAVSARVFLSARQIPRLLDALVLSYQRYQRRIAEAQARLQQRPGPQSQGNQMQAWQTPTDPTPPQDPSKG